MSVINQSNTRMSNFGKERKKRGTLSRVLKSARNALAATLMLAGFSMIESVKDIDHPDGSPLVFAFYGFSLFMIGMVIAFKEVIRRAD